MEKLAKADAHNADWKHGLLNADTKIGDVQFMQGNLKDALVSFGAALVVTQALVTDAPDNAAWQHDLSIVYAKIGDVQSALGDMKAALAAQANVSAEADVTKLVDASLAGLGKVGVMVNNAAAPDTGCRNDQLIHR